MKYKKTYKDYLELIGFIGMIVFFFAVMYGSAEIKVREKEYSQNKADEVDEVIEPIKADEYFIYNNVSEELNCSPLN